MEANATLTGRLLDLRKRFVQTMPDRIERIASTVDSSPEHEMASRLELQFHSLAGTAGTYDLHAVASAAVEGEAACTELKLSPLDRESRTYLSFLVDQLRYALVVDAPEQWSTRTVLTAVVGEQAVLEQAGVAHA